MNLHFAIDRPTLVRQIKGVVGARSDHSQKPVLGNALIEIKGDFFRLACTDIIIELRAGGAVTNISKEDGAVTVPAKKLHDLVTTMSDAEGQVEFRLNDASPLITLSVPRAHYKLATLPAADFPESQKLAGVEKVVLKATDLLGAIGRVRHAMGRNDARPYLNGMLIEADGTHMTCVATDGHRLSVARTDTAEAVASPVRAIISNRGVDALADLLRGADSNVTLELSKDRLRSQVGDRGMVAALCEGQYPDYKAVIPREQPYTTTFEREPFLTAVRRIATISHDKTGKPVVLNLNHEGFSLTANDSDDAGFEVIEADCPKCDIKMGINSDYLIAALEAMSSEKVTLQLRDYCSSILLTPAISDGAGHVIMPQRL